MRTTIRHTLRLAVFYLVAMIMIASSQTAFSQSDRNEYCPVTTSEKIDPNIFLDYEGKRIFFCCDKCKRDFLASPADYLANLTSSAEEPAIESTSLTGDASKSSDSVETVLSNQTGNGESTEHAGYDNDTDHGESTGVIAFLGKFHPVVIHFPIALVFMATILVGMRIFFNLPVLDQMSVIILCWAALFSVVASLLGLARGANSEFPTFLAKYFEWHRILGLLTTVGTIATAVIGFIGRRRSSRKAMITFKLLLILNVVLVSIAGHLGATLVYGPDYFGQ